MDIITIVVIAIGLSMDSFAVSITNGLTIRGLNLKKKIFISSTLSIFQALMPLLGWLIGSGYKNYIEVIDHWLAFLLLLFIGLKMVYEGIKKNNASEKSHLNLTILLGQSFATSIDAFAVGISFAFLNLSITVPILIIGIITLIISFIGLSLGKFLGVKFGKSSEIFGGLVLIGIGIKVLLEHLYFQ